MKLFLNYLKPFLYLLFFYLIVCTILRIVILTDAKVSSTLGIIDMLRIFTIGTINNTCIFLIMGIPFWLYLLFISDNKLRKPIAYIILILLIGILSYIILFNNVIKQYGSVLINIIIAFLALKIILFIALLLLPKQRIRIRLILYFITVFLFVSTILLNALSEYFFWNEFGVRYNFIAVDYLIYTNEVIGNIMESYPVIPMFTVLALVAAGITSFTFWKTKAYFYHLPTLRNIVKLSTVALASVLIGSTLLPFLSAFQNNNNIYSAELEADGVYKFYHAYKENNLNYFKFYPTINNAEALKIFQQNTNISSDNLSKNITDSLQEIHKNVVLISVESLSEEFLAHYGNTKNLTPFLDSIADKSMMFTNLYAVGNRTVRGLEALTLCIPPSPGESIIKQKDNKNKFSTGYIFKQKGYQINFIYGGYSYFDNMKDFFEGNGYSITDRSDFNSKEISFANIWGVCDEDMAKKAVETMNAQVKSGKPFFNHWMTVSNHRPFTYPNGKIDIPGDIKSRDGGVKYTDYALRRFFELSEKQSWFSNTVFIITADHCASSSGRVSLPLDKYRIPCIVYSPAFIPAGKVDTLMSQIDIMPTLFGLLHFRYKSKFVGENIFSKNYHPRAFVATYQDLGYIKNNMLTILSPVKQIKQFQLRPKVQPGVSPAFRYLYDEVPVKTINDSLKKEAVSYYQTMAWILQKGYYQK